MYVMFVYLYSILNCFNFSAAKRQKIEDLMSRVQAYLDQVKERQIKESMSLPSLRFGRSGSNWKQYQ